MAYQLLLNDNLKNFVEKLNIDGNQKKSLVAKIPLLTKEERMNLLTLLGDIYLLNLEEKETIEKLKNSWQT